MWANDTTQMRHTTDQQYLLGRLSRDESACRLYTSVALLFHAWRKQTLLCQANDVWLAAIPKPSSSFS